MFCFVLLITSKVLKSLQQLSPSLLSLLAVNHHNSKEIQEKVTCTKLLNEILDPGLSFPNPKPVVQE